MKKYLKWILLAVLCLLPNIYIEVQEHIHQNDCIEINDFSGAIMSDCYYQSGVITIIGPDPFMIVSGFDTDVHSIQFDWNEDYDGSVSVYYDSGNGFTEDEYYVFPDFSTNEIVNLPKTIPASSLRIDFNQGHDSDSSFNLNAVRLNNHWSLICGKAFKIKILATFAIIYLIIVLLFMGYNKKDIT